MQARRGRSRSSEQVGVSIVAVACFPLISVITTCNLTFTHGFLPKSLETSSSISFAAEHRRYRRLARRVRAEMESFHATSVDLRTLTGLRLIDTPIGAHRDDECAEQLQLFDIALVLYRVY